MVRLQTQLGWRLNEGDGDARYVLGAADNGALVGISPEELAASLATLEAGCV